MKQYIVDAFTDKVFHGNQAAVCVLEQWLPEKLMQNITRENNFSETAFAVKEQDGYRLRWFTPGGEIDLCGHATLGTAYVLFHFYEPKADRLTFHSMSGDLFICREGKRIVMEFPSYHCREIPVTSTMAEALGAVPVNAFLDRDLLLVYEGEQTIREMQPDFAALKQLPGVGVCVTAPGSTYDCVSRFFAPKLAVNEDPVTGSAHCMIAPYWIDRLEKDTICAYQASQRGGVLHCRCVGERTVLSGNAALFAASELYI